MTDELVRRVAARFASDEDDEPHDPSDGVIYKWQLDSLADKSAWKGYTYKLSVWTWDAANYEDQDEPDDWGDQKKHGPELLLEDVLKKLDAAPFKWAEWVDGEMFQSAVKKTKKTVTQAIAMIERLDGKPLSYEERKHIERELKIKR